MISIIIPTYNEYESISELLEAIESVFKKGNIDGEIIVVDDDSKDKTAETVITLGRIYKNIKLIKRTGKRGLSSAVIDGFNAAGGQILGVMDADLSHDPSIIPHMVDMIKSGEADLVVGSRYIKGGGAEKSWPLRRRLFSRAGAMLARPITSIKDPLSGYFLLNKEAVRGVDLNGHGFKILLDVFVKGRFNKVKEIPYCFRERRKGKSKFGTAIGLRYLKQLFSLYAFSIFFKKEKYRKKTF